MLARHGKLEHISRSDVKNLVHELQVHRMQLAVQVQKLSQINKSISEARDRYVHLYDSAPVGYFTLNRHGKCIKVNQAGVSMLHATAHQVINQPFHLWVAPEFREVWHTHLQKVFETGVRQTCEIKLVPPEGLPFYAALDSQMAPGEGGSRSCRTAMHDISACKQVESELHLKERLLDGASDSIFLHDFEGNFIYVNEAACRERGYKKEELLHEKVSVLDQPKSAKKRDNFLIDVAAKGEMIYETVHRCKDGSSLPVEIHARLIKLENQHLILSVARDLTQRRRAEKALQQERGLARQYLDIAGVVMVALDTQGLITLINKKGCDVLGYSEKEIVGRDWFKFCLPPADALKIRPIFNQLRKGDIEGAEYCENRVLTKDGEKRLIAFHNALLRDQDGRITGILCSGEDITERRQAESALQQSEKELTIRNRIAQIFLTVLDDAMYDAVMEVVLEAGESKFGVFGYIEENGALVVPSITRHTGDQPSTDKAAGAESPKQKWEVSALPQAIREGQSLFSNEPSPLIPPGPSPIKRCLTVPIRYFEKVIGVITVANKDTDYDNHDMHRMEMIADTIAPILNARLQRNKQEKARQWAEEALRLSAYKWRTTFDAIKDAVCLLDPDGRILQCNQAMMNLTGRSFDTILEHPCWEILHGTSQPLKDCPFMRMKQTHQREEAILSVKQGWVKETVDPIVDESGTLIGGVHLSTDITHVKQAEAALRESEERFRTIFDQAAVGVALVDASTGRFLKMNQKFCDILELPQDETANITFAAITHPDDLQSNLENLQQLRDGLVRNFSIETRFRRNDGSSVWVNLTVSAMRESAEPSQYHIVVVEDITQRQQAEIEIKQGLEKLHQTLRGTVQALSSTVETKDPYTAGHQRRVAQLACAIAQEMGLSQDQIEGMQVLSFLHDIGKIAVPAEILSRPGKISSIEFNLIKSHPEAGYNILKDIEFPWPIAQAVLQHHERLDGSGYPAGLSGSDIIQEAKILAVADVVEAMASHRPYRPSLGINLALDEIIKHKGILFDNEAVEACLRLFKVKNFTFH